MNRLLIILLGTFFSFVQCSTRFSSDKEKPTNLLMTLDSDFDSTRLKTILPAKINELKAFQKSQKGKYSGEVAVFIDMRISSKYNRFFVVNLKNDSIIERRLVSHGSGSETVKQDSLQFSNVPNSYMTSLGTYKIGSSYTGNFGKSYRLIGLDATNNKALARAVVLHRYSCVPDSEQVDPICTSLGCPMVSEAFFPVLEEYIDQQKLPVLMEIYY